MSLLERYLDEMFDRLAGTGAAGRRVLAETEDHLRAAIDEATAAGIPPEQAERQAVSRFGSPRMVATQLRRAQRGSVLTSVSFGTALLAGLALLVLGAAYLVNAIGVAVLLRLRPETLPACPAEPPSGFAADCSDTVAVMQSHALSGGLILLVAAVILVSRHLALRAVGPAPGGLRWHLWGVALFAVAAAGWFISPDRNGPLHESRGAGVGFSLAASAVAATAAIAL
ncbi:MAG TPA: permease prefix domain 1-containing protein, partial [Catenuloplanes sp.]